MNDLELLATAEPHVYATTPQGELSLFVLPRKRVASATTMAVVYFTGGGWRHGSPENMIANAAWLRDRGAVGIVADYRVASRHGTTPLDAVDDARTAMRWVRDHAVELGVDPNRIAAAGGSAGAHLAACCVGSDDAARPDALLLHNPVTGGPGFQAEFFAAHPEVSPIAHVAAGWPPTIVSHGTADEIVPYADAVAFVDLMRRAGNACELITLDNAPHSCDWPATNSNFPRVMARMTAFLREHGLLSPVVEDDRASQALSS